MCKFVCNTLLCVCNLEFKMEIFLARRKSEKSHKIGKRLETIVVSSLFSWCRWWDSNPHLKWLKTIAIVIFLNMRVQTRVQLLKKRVHLGIYNLEKMIFFIPDRMLVDLSQHVICLVSHTLHLIFIGDAKRVGFGCSEVP